MKLAVTGGAGFIGRWLAEAALHAGHDVSLIGRRDGVNGVHFGGAVYPYQRTDYTTDDLVRVIGSSDAIVHLAAERFSGMTRFDLFEENVRLAWAVLNAARRCSVCSVVMLSSISVYSRANPLPWDESTVPAPSTLYGASKVAAETLSQAIGPAAGLNVKQLRAAQLLGYGERAGFAATTFIERANRREALEVWGMGRERKEYVYVKDVAGAILAALDVNRSAGAYNVGAGTDTSIRELAELVNRVFENPAGIHTRAVEHEFTGEARMDIGKAAAQLGWRPLWSLEAALADIRAIMSARTHEVTYA
jgi:UDP-glucose 4-epimerase